MMVVAIGSIIGNFMTSYPMSANFKWLVVFGVAFIMLKYLNEDRYGVGGMFVVVVFLIAIVLPVGWYNSGSVNNNAIVYAFIFAIGVIILFDGWKRYVLLMSITFMFIGFIIVEYAYPGFLPVHDPTLVFWDRMIQVPLAIAISAGMLIQFTDAYHKSNNELEDLTTKYMRLAYTDALTGIGNRGYIISEMEKQIREQRTFVTLMIDLDNFKHVNDTYGHLWGDRLLQMLAESLQESFGKENLYGRYGGDEFIIILFMEMDEAEKRIEKFLEEVRSNRNFNSYGATISGGYAQYLVGMALDQYLKCIDMALYDAKGHGKDRILGVNSNEKTKAKTRETRVMY